MRQPAPGAQARELPTKQACNPRTRKAATPAPISSRQRKGVEASRSHTRTQCRRARTKKVKAAPAVLTRMAASAEALPLSRTTRAGIRGPEMGCSGQGKKYQAAMGGGSRSPRKVQVQACFEAGTVCCRCLRARLLRRSAASAFQFFRARFTNLGEANVCTRKHKVECEDIEPSSRQSGNDLQSLYTHAGAGAAGSGSVDVSALFRQQQARITAASSMHLLNTDQALRHFRHPSSTQSWSSSPTCLRARLCLPYHVAPFPHAVNPRRA